MTWFLSTDEHGRALALRDLGPTTTSQSGSESSSPKAFRARLYAQLEQGETTNECPGHLHFQHLT